MLSHNLSNFIDRNLKPNKNQTHAASVCTKKATVLPILYAKLMNRIQTAPHKLKKLFLVNRKEDSIYLFIYFKK